MYHCIWIYIFMRIREGLTMHQQQVVDTAYLLEKDVGANSEGGDTNKWLVPMEDLELCIRF